jgi:hypothetical protein
MHHTIAISLLLALSACVAPENGDVSSAKGKPDDASCGCSAALIEGEICAQDCDCCSGACNLDANLPGTGKCVGDCL